MVIFGTLICVGNSTDVPCVLCTVGPKLKAAAKEAEGVDWRTHLDACRKSREAVATKFPDVRSALDRIGREAKDAVDKIETRESYVNAQVSLFLSLYGQLVRRLTTCFLFTDGTQGARVQGIQSGAGDDP